MCTQTKRTSPLDQTQQEDSPGNRPSLRELGAGTQVETPEVGTEIEAMEKQCL